MKKKLPVYLEDRDLPVDRYSSFKSDNSNSYGYVNIMYLVSLIITIVSVLTVIFVGK